MDNVDFGSVVKSQIASYLRQNIYTNIPAIVVGISKFESEQVVDVQPCISRVYTDGVVIEPPVIRDAPVVFPSGGGGLMSFPIKAGDNVLVCFSMRSLDEWIEGSGSLATPQATRYCSMNDAIAIPCLYTKSSNLTPNKDDVEIKFNDLSFKLELGGDISLANPSYSLKLKANGDVLHSSGAKITAAGDFVSATGISLNSHVHGGVQTGGGSTGVPS